MTTIAIGADDAAFDFRNKIIEYLNDNHIEFVDYSSDRNPDNKLYPDVAHNVATAIKEGKRNNFV